MTKNINEVIIDEVDVSKCIYKCKYDNYDCRDMFIYNWCKNNPDCYFKQLQRLKQENEKLQNIKDFTYFKLKEEYEAKIHSIVAVNVGILAECNALKIRNRELKKENKKLKEIIDKAKNSSITLESFFVGECYEREIEKYIKCLEEIKETVGFHTSNSDSQDIQDDMNEILNKINEVLDEE